MIKNTSCCSKPEHEQKKDNEEYFTSKNQKGKMKQRKNKTKQYKTYLYSLVILSAKDVEHPGES